MNVCQEQNVLFQVCIKLTHWLSCLVGHIHLTIVKSLYKNFKKGHSVHSNVDDHVIGHTIFIELLELKVVFRNFFAEYTLYIEKSLFAYVFMWQRSTYKSVKCPQDIECYHHCSGWQKH